ncbi:MAG: 4-hydroxy-tetrahydrodipicolinate reductase [Candidatus Riflebacteria bacterium]|nr:4-hydroxy-tetrahydrodipicolinate reductase [Candidatus Riflebacteria bacterium]
MKRKILVSGSLGKMGKTLCDYIKAQPDYELVAGVDKASKETGALFEGGYKIYNDLKQALSENQIDVIIDFTEPKSVFDNILTAIENKTPIIVGTTGLKDAQKEILAQNAQENGTPVLIVPNFAIGAILMAELAAKAAKYMQACEIIELHHDAKKDKPSGTSIETRKGILKALGKESQQSDNSIIPIHSVRLPGLVAHQEVILGALGQTLTIRHDSYDRNSFMPGIRIAIEQIQNLKGLSTGLKL